jgi:hypothetical protein
MFQTGFLNSRNTTVGQLMRPYPHFNAVTMRNPTIGNSTYHAALVKVERRFSQGLTFLVSYMASKLIDDVATPQNNFFIAGERALSDIDRSQRLILSGVYELPLGPGKALSGGSNRVARKALEGWQLNWITTFMAGQPLAVTSNVNTKFRRRSPARPATAWPKSERPRLGNRGLHSEGWRREGSRHQGCCLY